MDSSLIGHEVAKVSRVVGVRDVVWIVVAGSGVTPLAEVSILVDVHCSELWTLSGEATEAQEDLEASLRIFLLKQHLPIHFRQIIRQCCAGSHFACCIESAMVLGDLWWSGHAFLTL